MKTYREYKESITQGINKLPIFWAFGDKQFEKAMNERGLSKNDINQIYALGGGGYYLRKDAEVVRNYFNSCDELEELMKDFEFAKSAFYEEICNHEYIINCQGDYDVISCFYDIEWLGDSADYNDYFKVLGVDKNIITAYERAITKYQLKMRKYY